MYLGIDLGTGSVKVMILGRSGEEYVTSSPYTVSAPQEGYAETDPELWLEALQNALVAVAEVRGAPGLSDIEGIGFSGQMHGIVPVRYHDSGVPEALHPAILWADGRGSSELGRYHDIDPELQRRLGNQPASGMAGPTLLWLLKHRPEVLSNADSVLFAKDFVRAVLTGDRITDHSDASGSLLYDVERRDWSEEVVGELGIPRGILPEIGYGVDKAGVVRGDAAERFGLPVGIPVAIGVGDTPAAMYGTRLTDPSVAQISVGTAAQVSRPITPDETIAPGSTLNTFEGAEEDLRYQVAAMLNGGLALEWVRERLQFEWNALYERIDERVGHDPGGIVFLPYLSGERTPHLNPDARGAWVGIGLHHDNDDLAIAALLGVACTVRLGLETLELGRPAATKVRMVGGSARHHVWRRIVSMIIQRSIEYSVQTDSSARGAAYLAIRMLGGTVPHGPSFSTEDVDEIGWVEKYYHRFREVYTALHS